MTKYLALTIGPIYNTFSQACETRTVWASSFFFSWFIKQVLIKAKEKEFHIFLPYDDNIALSQWGSGLYADRIYFVEDDKTTKNGLIEILESIIKSLAQDIFNLIDDKPLDEDVIKKFLDDYINLHIAEVKIDKPILKTINGILDHRELKQNFAFRYDRNYLMEYLDLKVSEGSLLANDAFGKDNLKKRRFRSIPEISTTTLDRLHKNEYNNVVYGNFKNEIDLIESLANNEIIRKDFRQYQKYYAVLYADGDNIGQLLESTNDEELQLKEFSKQLLAFGKLAEGKIASYGGNGIYLGGEDVLTFAPMACISKNGNELRTIFSLIDELDQDFAATVGHFAEKQGVSPLPTLSYGIMISYVKHPLKESMNMAHQLMDKAKNRDIYLYKNTIGLRFQKHSGQYMECFIEKSKANSKKTITDFVDKYCKNTLKDREENILSGVIQRFRDDLYFATFTEAAKRQQLEAFFANFFDEKVHSEEDKDQFLRDVRLLGESIFSEYNDVDACRKILFTILRFVHFINQKKD
jgi:CRISPR-associated protein Cmr2